MNATKNTISKNDTIKATAYDANGNFISELFDSGFSSIKQVIAFVESRAPKFSNDVKKIMIYNETKEWCDTYTISGKKI